MTSRLRGSGSTMQQQISWKDGMKASFVHWCKSLAWCPQHQQALSSRCSHTGVGRSLQQQHALYCCSARIASSAGRASSGNRSCPAAAGASILIAFSCAAAAAGPTRLQDPAAAPIGCPLGAEEHAAVERVRAILRVEVQQQVEVAAVVAAAGALAGQAVAPEGLHLRWRGAEGDSMHRLLRDFDFGLPYRQLWQAAACNLGSSTSGVVHAEWPALPSPCHSQARCSRAAPRRRRTRARARAPRSRHTA